ncbi:MAG: hypothetical protein ACRBCJ_13485 [Hyphomicrobiaceae bacterium]
MVSDRARAYIREMTVALFVTVVVVSFATANSASALKVGDWEGVCMAPNHLTGEIERVQVSEVSARPLFPWFGRTMRMPDGTWKIDINVFFLFANRLSNAAKKFIFYHECAHARLDVANERTADCEALAEMKRAMDVTDQAIKDIEYAYLLILRTFPTGGPCDQPSNYNPPQTATNK